jgi:hypothetical protein
VDLTPGVSIAPSVIQSVDTNADNAIAPAEAEAYGRAVLSDLLVTLDGDPVEMTLVRIEVPAIDEMRHGMGTIRLRTSGSVGAGAGNHRLRLLNRHRPDTSIYMVNALLPEDAGVELVSQTRDPLQREFDMEYAVGQQWPVRLLWLGIGGAGLAAVVGRGRVRRSERRSRKNA